MHANCNQRKILFLCTDEEAPSAMRHWLEHAGFSGVEPASSDEALSLLQEGGFVALVLDRFLPPWPGLPTILQLKSAYPGLRVVVVGEPASETVMLARTFGADRTVVRPLRRDAVLAAFAA